MSTSENLARLKKLATSAGESIFERAKLAADVLEDKGWVDREHGGDYAKAEEFVADQFFPELTMAFTLGQLLVLVKHFSDVAVWRQHRFGLVRLWDEYTVQVQKPEREKRTRRQPTIKEMEEKDDKLASVEYALKRSNEVTDALQAENKRLKGELADKDRRIAYLEGKVEALETELRRIRTVAA